MTYLLGCKEIPVAQTQTEAAFWQALLTNLNSSTHWLVGSPKGCRGPARLSPGNAAMSWNHSVSSACLQRYHLGESGSADALPRGAVCNAVRYALIGVCLPGLLMPWAFLRGLNSTTFPSWRC